jgi:hypothetical protein
VASSGQVYVANGSGSGTWTSISTTINPFGTQLFHVRTEGASGTAGGTFNAGSYVTRALNTIKTNEISGASLASNQISLPAGTYYIVARACGNAVGAHKAKLRNITDSSDTIVGSVSLTGTNAQTDSWIVGRFTIGGAKVFELQQRCNVTTVTSGLGAPCSFGDVEVYADVMIWRIS